MIRLPHSCTQKSAAGSVAEQAVVAAREMEHGSWLRIEPRRSRDESRRLTNALGVGERVRAALRMFSLFSPLP